VTFAGTDFKGAARPAGQERVTDPHPIRGGAAAQREIPPSPLVLISERGSPLTSRLRQAGAPAAGAGLSSRRIS
jgi:hypothetical protein